MSTPTAYGIKLQKDDGSHSIDASTYRSMVGFFVVFICNKLDIMFATNLLSRSMIMNSPTENHLTPAKRVLRYVQGTAEFGLFYRRLNGVKLLGFSDNDWAGSLDDMKSTTGFCFSLGSDVICWGTRKQASVVQSTTEAKYVAASATVNQAIWLRNVLIDLNFQQENPTKILCDNKISYCYG
ncbi:secreted RxLR effector protein 161-like [Jatropha curcas]|uniref:secreted RxLR effector protein 161-like n=1 Tax=Jatropha curcas TaxID=180498 RepID=UPI0018939F50|nr:secreted RxLR effector protein 161-like [Jatropha curcas]